MKSVVWILLRVLFDILALIPIIVVAILLNQAPSLKSGFFADDDSLKYPYRDSTISSIYLFTVGPIFCIITVVVVEVVRAHNYGFTVKHKSVPLLFLWLYKFLYLIGFGYAVTALLTDLGKYVIGRLRPHFFSVCMPTALINNTFGYTMDYTCSGTDAKKIFEVSRSFPSGHSSYAMYPAVFICMYLHYRMPTIAVGSVLQAFVQTTVIALAFYTGLTRVTDYKHHWSDVLAGFILGFLIAVFTVRYASDVDEFEEAETQDLENTSKGLRERFSPA